MANNKQQETYDPNMHSRQIILHLSVLVWITLFAIGCQKRIRTSPPNAEVVTEAEQSTVQLDEKGPGADLPNALNSAKAAALYVSSLPIVDNLWILREIGLHSSLYKASYERRLGDASRGFLLCWPMNADIGALAIDLDEFRLRVLAELSELGPPIEWAISSYDATGAIDGFHGARKAPTHLCFRIIERIDDQATVLAEINSQTPRARSVRQLVSCTFDGEQWRVKPLGLRTGW